MHLGVSNSREISKIYSREFFSPFPGIPGNPGNSILFKLVHYFSKINAFLTFPYQYFNKMRSLRSNLTPQYFVILLCSCFLSLTFWHELHACNKCYIPDFHFIDALYAFIWQAIYFHYSGLSTRVLFLPRIQFHVFFIYLTWVKLYY